MNTLNNFRSFSERTMTTKEKSKEDRLKDKYDDSSMKNNMKDQYGEEEGEKVYYATIRKQAMKKEEVEVDEGVIDVVKKGAKRHAKAIQAKKIKDRKAVPYAALAAEHEPEGEQLDEFKGKGTFNDNTTGVSSKGGLKSQYNKPGKLSQSSFYNERKLRGKTIMSKKKLRKEMEDDARFLQKSGGAKSTPSNLKTALKKQSTSEEVQSEDYHSGTGEKVQKRTLAWMQKKGQKGAPGLDAMKARAAEHKAKRGVKEEVVDEAKVDTGRSDYGKASIRNKRAFGIEGKPEATSGSKERGKMIDARRYRHKTKRGIKKGDYKIDEGNGYQPEIEHSKLGDATKKAKKEKESKLPPHLQGDAIGKMKKAFASTNKESFYNWRSELLGEEDYDKMKDARLVKYGIGHDGSDRKGPSSPPPKSKVKGKTVLQKETEKKYGKGVSAIDVVTAKIRDKYGKDAIMKPKK